MALWICPENCMSLCIPVLATCGIRCPELACENTSCCLLLLADSSEEEYNGKH